MYAVINHFYGCFARADCNIHFYLFGVYDSGSISFVGDYHICNLHLRYYQKYLG